MDIYPQDLGRANESAAQRRREYFRRAPLPGDDKMAAKQPHWTGALLIPAFGFLPLTIAFAMTDKYGIWLPFAAVHGGIGVLVLLIKWIPIWRRRTKQRVSFVRTVEQSLTAQEIEWLRADATDPLQGSFCDLALTAIASPALPDVLSEAHLRDALRCLGEAVHDVPELSFKLTPQDAKEMVTVAGRLMQDAQGERDMVVADSLRRRADALRGQADTVHRAQTLLRRNQTLRLELFDQIAALRTGLAAAAIGQRDGARGLSELAESIQSVAAEAAAVTGARAEVDNYLHPETSTIPSPISINRGQS